MVLLYKIGDFSRLCRVSVKTLRYYDDIGILKPDFIDKYTGYRYYEPVKLSRYYQIAAMKEIGFSLEEIGCFFENGRNESVIELVAKKQQELSEQASAIQFMISRLDSFMTNLCQEGDTLSGNVIIKQNEEIRLATVRGLLKDRSEIADRIKFIKEHLRQSNIKHSSFFAVINYDTEYCTENLDLEVGVQIFDRLKDNCFLKEKVIDTSIPTASTVCGNNCEEIEKAYSSLYHYADNQRYQIIGAFYECYHENKLVEIQVPVHKLLNDSLKEPKNDNIDIQFENDERVIGRWEVYDCLPTVEHFCPQKIKHTGSRWFDEVYFLPKGEEYWTMAWTKGYLITSCDCPKRYSLNKYEIKRIDEQNYMFIEMKNSVYHYYNGLPEIWVLKQTDNKEYSKNDIRIQENTDYPFIKDEAVIGKWKSCDLVKSVEDFDPYNRSFSEEYLYYLATEFKDNGDFIEQFKEIAVTSPNVTWTKGLVLCHYNKTAPAYELKRVDGCDYLFIEWKSGDYTYARQKPYYYVFRRDE